MAARSFRIVRIVMWPALLGVAYFCMAALSLHLMRGSDGIATIWPASGILLAALLLTPPARWPAFMAIAGVASMVANLNAGEPLPQAIALSIVNIGEALLATLLMRRHRAVDLSFSDPASVGRFVLAALFASFWSATLASLVANGWSLRLFASWFSTVALGMLIVTPVVLTGANLAHLLRSRPSPKLVFEGAAIFGAILIVSIGVFFQSSYPLLFLPMLGVLIATYRMGPLGAAVSVLLIAIVGSLATAYGRGPVTFVNGVGPAILFFQFYLVTLLGSALPLAALLASRGRMIARIGRGKRLLEMAERAAHVGHWRLSLGRRTLFWSAEVFRMHGMDENGDPPSADDAISFYHPDDRARVRSALRQLERTEKAFDMDARIVRHDGTVRDVNLRGEMEQGALDEPVALFGMVQDVTARVEAIRALHAARDAAEHEARRAVMMAETDQLTGIPNRRKALAVLEQRLANAVGTGQPFSIAMLDIDHFKSINDEYGHAVGDEVLTRVARLCRSALRDTDLVGRIGGEEFLLVIDGAAPAEALVVAERVRRTIHAAGPTPSGVRAITASLGVATFRPGMDMRSLMQAADEALYAAKNGGRNTLRVAA